MADHRDVEHEQDHDRTEDGNKAVKCHAGFAGEEDKDGDSCGDDAADESGGDQGDDGADHVEDLKRLKPFIKEYAPVLIGVNRGADALVKAGYRPDLIVGDPEMITTNTLRSGAQVVLPAAPDGPAAPGPAAIREGWFRETCSLWPGQALSLQLGFSHEVDIDPPAGVTFAVPVLNGQFRASGKSGHVPDAVDW